MTPTTRRTRTDSKRALMAAVTASLALALGAGEGLAEGSAARAGKLVVAETPNTDSSGADGDVRRRAPSRTVQGRSAAPAASGQEAADPKARPQTTAPQARPQEGPSSLRTLPADASGALRQNLITGLTPASQTAPKGALTMVHVQGNGDCVMCVDQGDGSPARCTSVPAGFPQPFGHRYERDGIYTVRSSGGGGSDGCQGSATATVAVGRAKGLGVRGQTVDPALVGPGLETALTGPHISDIQPEQQRRTSGKAAEVTIRGIGTCGTCIDPGDGSEPRCSTRQLATLPQTFSHTYAEPGTYRITATGGGKPACAGSASATVEVVPHALEVGKLPVHVSSTILSVAPAPSRVGEPTFAWVKGLGQCVMCVDMGDGSGNRCTSTPAGFPQQFGHTYDEAGTYTVSATGGSGDDGCQGSASATVAVGP